VAIQRNPAWSIGPRAARTRGPRSVAQKRGWPGYLYAKMAAVSVVHIASLDQDLELAHRIKGKGSGSDGGGCAQQVRLYLSAQARQSGDVATHAPTPTRTRPAADRGPCVR
jgi:hypothetical protein